jgi:hypothetical protein
MKTGGAIGHAVGTAAGLCKKHGCTPRQLYETRTPELQQELLKTDATILNLKNSDPDDLARTAKVTATSESVFECTEATDFLPLDCPRGVVLYDWPQELNSLDLFLRNTSEKRIGFPLAVSLYKSETKWKDEESYRKYYWGRDMRLEKFRHVLEGRFHLQPKHDGWFTVDFQQKVNLGEKDPTSDDERCLILLGPAPEILWARQSAPADFMRRCWIQGNQMQVAPEQHLLKLDPRPPFGEAAHVVNGYNRRFATCPTNMWIAKRGEPLPQSLILDFGSPKSFKTVHLAFDTIGYTYRDMPFNCDQRVSPMCAKDYALESWDGAAWQRIANIEDNYNRFRVHTFPSVTASRLRLTVKAVHDAARWTARVYEIRVYHT